MEVKLHTFITSTPDGGEWSVSLFSRFTPAEGPAGVQCVLGWLDSVAGLDPAEKEKPFAPIGDGPLLPISFNPQHSHCTECTVPVHKR
jgi:hypothetical protein